MVRPAGLQACRHGLAASATTSSVAGIPIEQQRRLRTNYCVVWRSSGSAKDLQQQWFCCTQAPLPPSYQNHLVQVLLPINFLSQPRLQSSCLRFWHNKPLPIQVASLPGTANQSLGDAFSCSSSSGIISMQDLSQASRITGGAIPSQ